MLIDIKTKYEKYRCQSDETEPLTAQREDVHQVPLPAKVCFIFYLLIIYVSGFFIIRYGAIHIDDCPAKNMLPISLIVIGSLVIVIRVVNCPYDFQKVFYSWATPVNTIVAGITILLVIVCLGWLMAKTHREAFVRFSPRSCIS